MQYMHVQHIHAQHMHAQHMHAQHMHAQHMYAQHMHAQHMHAQHMHAQHMHAQHIHAQHRQHNRRMQNWCIRTYNNICMACMHNKCIYNIFDMCAYIMQINLKQKLLNERTLNPRSGGREQLVANLSSCRFCLSVKLSTTFQNMTITGCSGPYPPDVAKHTLIRMTRSGSRILIGVHNQWFGDGSPQRKELSYWGGVQLLHYSPWICPWWWTYLKRIIWCFSTKNDRERLFDTQELQHYPNSWCAVWDLRGQSGPRRPRWGLEVRYGRTFEATRCWQPAPDLLEKRNIAGWSGKMNQFLWPI